MTGSRFAFLGLVCLLCAAWLKNSPRLTVKSVAKSLAATAAVALVLSAIVLYFAPTNRLRQLLLFGSNSEYQSVEDVGTFAARLMTYEAVIADVSTGGLAKLMFGSGTSTSGEAIVRHGLVGTIGFTHEDLVDPNRALNSDFFRGLYEWGLVGTSLGMILLIRLLGWTWGLAIRDRFVPGLALLGMLPTIVIGLLTENVLVDAASPLGIGFILVLTWAFAGRELRDARAGFNVGGVRLALPVAPAES